MASIVLGLFAGLIGVYFISDVTWSPGWMAEFLFVIKGLIPFGFFMLAVLALLLGVADVVDRARAKKETQKLLEKSKKESM